MANYAWTTGVGLPVVENGHHFVRCNFSQKVPHTKIYEGVSGLRFEGCNLMNCDVPIDAEVIDCLNIHVSLCSHIHPEFVERGLDVCVQNCSHVTDVDTVVIDGVTVDTIYHYEDKAA